MQFNSHGFDFNCFFFTKKNYFKQFFAIEKFSWITDHQYAYSFGTKESVEYHRIKSTIKFLDRIQFAPVFFTKQSDKFFQIVCDICRDLTCKLSDRCPFKSI